MAVQSLKYSELFGENFQSRECLSALLFTLVLVKLVQLLVNSCRKSTRKIGKFEVNQEVNEKGMYEAYQSLPGPKPFPVKFIGNTLMIFWCTDVIKTVQTLAKKYGPCYRINLFGDDYVVLNTPQLVQALLSSNDIGHLGKGGLEVSLWPESVHSLVTYTGTEWKTRRKMLNRSFTYRSLQRYNSSFNRHSNKLIMELGKLFEDGKMHVIDEIVRTCVLRQTSETLMGVELSESEGALFCECAETALNTNFKRVFRPWLYPNFTWNLHPLSRKLNDSLQQMSQVTHKIINTYLENIKKGDQDLDSYQDLGYDSDTLNVANGPSSGNMMEILIHHGVPEKDIFNEVVVMLAIAYDTTSISIIFALFLLASNPSHQKICQEEIDAIFSDPEKYRNNTLEFHALADLKYLERCIFEAQRLYPLATAMRKMESPLRLSKDLVVPAGAIVFYMSHVIHLNAEYYPNPEVFDPDRFLPEQVKSRHPYAYLPFSSGPRTCIGMKLAIIELKMVLAKILYNFEITTTDKVEDVKLNYNGIPKPSKPINFNFKKRNMKSTNTNADNA